MSVIRLSLDKYHKQQIEIGLNLFESYKRPDLILVNLTLSHAERDIRFVKELIDLL